MTDTTAAASLAASASDFVVALVLIALAFSIATRCVGAVLGCLDRLAVVDQAKDQAADHQGQHHGAQQVVRPAVGLRNSRSRTEAGDQTEEGEHELPHVFRLETLSQHRRETLAAASALVMTESLSASRPALTA